MNDCNIKQTKFIKIGKRYTSLLEKTRYTAVQGHFSPAGGMSVTGSMQLLTTCEMSGNNRTED